jgi:putative membrane protein
VTTLVCCVDRSGAIGERAGLSAPIAGWEAVRSLVTDVGLADPEATSVNCLLAALQTTRELRDEGREAVVAVLSGTSGSAVAADRAIATQLETLIERYDPTSAIVVIDSAADERVVPVIESRLPIDGVDRVVVRQARDIESTYYLLKQFLADEELRATVLVPLGIGLLLVPALLVWVSPTAALAGFASLLGAAVLYKGLGVDALVGRLLARSRELLYSGQVSVVTAVTAAGLLVVGLLAGGLAVSDLPGTEPVALVTAFVHNSVPWLALAAVAASVGRLIDGLIGAGTLRASTLSLPFVLLAVGVVVRGFTGYVFAYGLSAGPVALTPLGRLALFILAGLLVSLVGVSVATTLESRATATPADR